MHGKTGLAIQFYHLAKKTGNTAFETFSGELLDDIIQALSTQVPLDFENGLAGIGWGFEYLIQNGFLDADADDVLEELDNQIFRTFLGNTSANFSLLNGVLGTGYYFLKRIRGACKKQKNVIIGTNELALLQICDQLNQMVTANNGFAKEPCEPTTSNVQKSSPNGYNVPFFDITWNLTALIGFLIELQELNTPKFDPTNLLNKVLTPLLLTSSLPLLQCNRMLLLYHLIKLKNTVDMKQGNSKNEIGLLSNQIIKNIITGFDNEKYNNELCGLNFSIRNGISGVAIIQRKLYEQTCDLKYKNEHTNLLSKLKQKEFISRFRYDYSNPVKVNEHELGVLQGISGLLVTALLTETD